MATKKGANEKVPRRSVLDVLNEAGGTMSPDALFDRAGFSGETVDEFFSELRALTQSGKIADDKTNGTVRMLIPVTLLGPVSGKTQ